MNYCMHFTYFSDDDTVEKIIKAIKTDNRIPKSGTAVIFLQTIIPDAAAARDVQLLLRISKLGTDQAVRLNALEYLVRLLHLSADSLCAGGDIEKLLLELEPNLRFSLSTDMWDDTPVCALHRQHAYLLLLTHFYVKYLQSNIDTSRIDNLLKTRDQVMKNLAVYKQRRVERSKLYVERFRYIFSFMEHILRYRLASKRLSFVAKVTKNMGMGTKVKKTSGVMKDMEYICKNSVPGLHEPLLKKCATLNGKDLHIFLHFMVSKVSIESFYFTKLISLMKSMY